MANADTPVVAAAGSTAVVQRGFSGPTPGTGLFVALSLEWVDAVSEDYVSCFEFFGRESGTARGKIFFFFFFFLSLTLDRNLRWGGFGFRGVLGRTLGRELVRLGSLWSLDRFRCTPCCILSLLCPPPPHTHTHTHTTSCGFALHSNPCCQFCSFH